MINSLKIKDATDREIIELVELCSYMFTVHSLSDKAASSFCSMLKYKFPLMTFGRVQQLCTDTAANPPKYDFRFTPSFLATIIQSHERRSEPLSSWEREATMAEKAKYRKEFLDDLYADFDAFTHGAKMTRIKVWQYVAELLVRCGYAEHLPVISEERNKISGIKDLLSQNEPFVHDCFRKMISNKQHISQYIHGFEN